GVLDVQTLPQLHFGAEIWDEYKIEGNQQVEGVCRGGNHVTNKMAMSMPRRHGHRHLVFHMIPTSGGVDQIIPLVQKADDGGSEPRVDNYYISLRCTVEHGDFAVANCSVSLSVIGKLISRWTTAITVDHHGLGGSR
ncbi:hypothetical protein DPMN_061421, partial [Dreissena polymorpha]